MDEKGKGKWPLEAEATESSSSEKPTATHLEDAKGGRDPYWDNQHVIGASRNLPGDSPLTAQDRLDPTPGRMRRLARHYKRHWKLYTLIAIILLAIGLPIIFLVIFPAVAQRMVDDAKLPIQSAMILNPTPSSVDYSLVASLKIPKGFSVDLKPIALSLYTEAMGEKEPYIKVSLPEYHLKGTTTVSISNQTAVILDQPQFQSFLSDAVYSQNFTLSTYGSTAAYLGALKAKIKLKKKVELAGLNKLEGFSFKEAAIVLPPESDGTNLKGTVILPNPSIVTFALGNVTLNMWLGKINVGQGRLYNVLLHPGNNTVAIRATADLKAIISNIPQILSSQVDALKTGNIEIAASGNSTIYNGKHIPYYESVLNNLTITGQTPILQILTDSLSQFLGSDAGSLLSGVLGNLNTTGIGGIAGLLGGLGNSSSSGGLDLGTILGPLRNLTSGTSSSSSVSSLPDATSSVRLPSNTLSTNPTNTALDTPSITSSPPESSGSSSATPTGSASLNATDQLASLLSGIIGNVKRDAPLEPTIEVAKLFAKIALKQPVTRDPEVLSDQLVKREDAPLDQAIAVAKLFAKIALKQPVTRDTEVLSDQLVKREDASLDQAIDVAKILAKVAQNLPNKRDTDPYLQSLVAKRNADAPIDPATAVARIFAKLILKQPIKRNANVELDLAGRATTLLADLGLDKSIKRIPSIEVKREPEAGSNLHPKAAGLLNNLKRNKSVKRNVGFESDLAARAEKIFTKFTSVQSSVKRNAKPDSRQDYAAEVASLFTKLASVKQSIHREAVTPPDPTISIAKLFEKLSLVQQSAHPNVERSVSRDAKKVEQPIKREFPTDPADVLAGFMKLKDSISPDLLNLLAGIKLDN